MASIFSRIIAGEIPSYKVAEDANYYAFLDINPLTEGHTLVVPKKEVDYIFDLDDQTLAGMMLFAKKILEIEGEKYLKHAALHRLFALDTISGLLKDQIPIKHSLDLYLHNHRSNHFVAREAAILDCNGLQDDAALKKASLRFYLARLGASTEPFCAMANTMPEFRNGVYHMLADESQEKKDEEFHWKLWE